MMRAFVAPRTARPYDANLTTPYLTSDDYKPGLYRGTFSQSSKKKFHHSVLQLFSFHIPASRSSAGRFSDHLSLNICQAARDGRSTMLVRDMTASEANQEAVGLTSPSHTIYL